MIATHEDTPTLQDNLGNTLAWTGVGDARHATYRYEGAIDPAATFLIFAMDRYPVPEQPDWVLTIPLD